MIYGLAGVLEGESKRFRFDDLFRPQLYCCAGVTALHQRKSEIEADAFQVSLSGVLAQ